MIEVLASVNAFFFGDSDNSFLAPRVACSSFLVSAEVAVIQPTIGPKGAAMPPGVVRAAASALDGQYLLIAPASPGASWFVAKREAWSRPVNVPPRTLTALGNKHLAWIRPTGMHSSLTLHSIADGQESTHDLDIRGVFAMSTLGDVVFLLGQNAGAAQLYRFDSANGKTEKLDEFPFASPSIRFGECSEDPIVLIDAVDARFRVYTVAPSLVRGSWTDIAPSVVSAIKKGQTPPTTVSPRGRVAIATVYGHRIGGDGSHWFLVAKFSKGVGRFAVRVGSQGTALEERVLAYPGGDAKKVGSVAFERVIRENGALQVITTEGVTVEYGGFDL